MTGLPNEKVFGALCDFLVTFPSEVSLVYAKTGQAEIRQFPLEDQLLITLFKFRSAETDGRLAVLFRVRSIYTYVFTYIVLYGNNNHVIMLS